MLLSNYQPHSKLVTQTTRVSKPRFPVIDAHNHLAEPFGGGWDKKPFSALLDHLDEAGVKQYVDLDGGWGEAILYQHLDLFKAKAPQRFQIFGGVDWAQWKERGNGFADWAAGKLRKQKEAGAQGLKIWKGFGLSVRDENDCLAKIDDVRLSPIWEAAGELNLPVVIHVADPLAFFDPVDEHNERWEEINAHPDWAFTSPPYPPAQTILTDFYRLVESHPRTTFIGAHVGCQAENLVWVDQVLERCPNFYVDIAARISELGRQPYAARRFFLKHAGRILFGLDLGPDVPSYQIYYRFLESDDEYFNYNPGDIPLQGRWQIYGLFLPDDILEKVYCKNAEAILNH